ncbi:MAG: peptidoglycan D,D-transpeptidase FtsI family protein [Endomicrobiia bacterium]
MKTTNDKLFFVFIGFSIVSVLLIARMFYLQVWEHNKYIYLVSKQVSNKKISNPERGIIFDRKYKVLAMNIDSISVGASPRYIKDKELFSKVISQYIDESPAEIFKKIDNSENFVWIKRQLNIKDSEKIQDLSIDGLIVLNERKRYYPFNKITSHIVGVTSIDGYGLSGIEYIYDNIIKRKNDGRNQFKIYINKKSKIQNVVLTIDSTLQYIAYREIEKAVEKYHPKKAFVVMQNPKNGEILALVCYPSFDPNEYNFTSKDLLNPVIHEVFEPGSTFKIVTLSAALSEKYFKTDDVIFCENGSFKFADIEINDHIKYGYLTLEGITAYSSNIGFAKVGLKLGKENLYKWIKRFGFGSFTGCILPGEQAGLVFSPYSKRWSLVTSPTVSFGQGIGVTGLQLINAFSSIANDGLLFEPIVIKEIVDENGKILWKYQPRVIRRVILEDVAKEVKDILLKTVEYGTGKLAQVQGYNVCGKTGTAQKIDPLTRKYSKSKYISSFCGFLPYENPHIVILVVLDEPQTNYWASEVACPVFSNIAKETMNYLNIPQKEEDYAFTKLTY